MSEESIPRKKTESAYIPTLDGWRAIAVSLVIAAHSAPMLANNGSRLALLLRSFVTHAGYGVDIFFALSGFLICSLLLREKERMNTISLSRFYVRRVFRILPPMFLYLLFITALSLLSILPHISLTEFLSVVFFFRNYMDGTWYTGHFWSLAVEEHFYLFAPVFILSFPRKWAIRATFVLIAGCIFIRWFEYSHDLFAGSLLQFRTENRYDGLLWGCLLAFALRSESVTNWLRKRLNLIVFILTAISAVVLLTVFTSQPARRTIVAAVMPILIAYTVLNPTAFIGRILELSPMRWIGRLSYSLYLWQMLFLPEFERPLGVIQSFPLSLILPIVCAAISFYFVEKPMIRIGHKLAQAPGIAPSHRLD